MELAQMTIQDVKEMDLADLEEALPRLQEEAVRAEEVLRGAQERMREDADRRAPVPSFVEVHGDQLVVNIKTRDKKLILLSSIRIPSRTCPARKRIQRSHGRCGGGCGSRASRCQGFGSTLATVAEIKPS